MSRFRPPDQLLMPWAPGKTVSTARAAEMLDVSSDTIIRMAESGELRGYQVRRRMRNMRRGSPWKIYVDSVLKIAGETYRQSGVEPPF